LFIPTKDYVVDLHPVLVKVSDAMHWARAFSVHWAMSGPFAHDASVFLQNASARIAMSSDTLPWTSMFQICWYGALAGIQIGLTDASSINAYVDSQRSPPGRTRRTTFACGLRLRPELPATLPLWTFGSLPVGGRRALDVSDLVRHHHYFGITYHELNVRLRWNTTDYVLHLNGQLVESIRLGPRDGLPYLRGRSRLVLSWFWLGENSLPLVRVCPRDNVMDSHLQVGRSFPVPCQTCLPCRDDAAVAVCSACNAGYCSNHGGRCNECDLQLCVDCVDAHIHVN
jgi:hypothetical protein